MGKGDQILNLDKDNLSESCLSIGVALVIDPSAEYGRTR